MRTRINEQWRELRPQIGNFISTLEALYKGAENVEEAISRAEDKGYRNGFTADKSNMCSKCEEHEFYKKCNSYIEVIERFMELNPQNKIAISNVINALYTEENR